MEKKEMAVENTAMYEKSIEVKEQETEAGDQVMESKEQTVVETEPVRHEIIPEVYFQYREYEADLAAVTERVKSHYISKGYTEDSIKELQIYVKPEDFTAYYVINDDIVGKVNLF